VRLRNLRTGYKPACETSNRIVEVIGDPDAPTPRNRKTGDLRWVLSAVIGETARHAGHADIIREQIDAIRAVSPSLSLTVAR
jgi:Protein of unknown function (DUF664)